MFRRKRIFWCRLPVLLACTVWTLPLLAQTAPSTPGAGPGRRPPLPGATRKAASTPGRCASPSEQKSWPRRRTAACVPAIPANTS